LPLVIAAIGELLLDVTIVPEGELVLDDDRDAQIRIGGGGQAANFCAWVASLGEPATLIANAGDDEIGRRLVAELRAAGVRVPAPASAGRPTGAIAVLVGEAGRHSFARQRGADLTAEQIDPAWLEGARLLHVSGHALYREPLAGCVRRCVEVVRAQGALISIDLASPAGLRALGPERLVAVLGVVSPDLLFATEAEAAELPDPIEALARVAVMKLGARGCRVHGRRVPAPKVRAVDSTGAGDAFAAAFCVAYLDGATPLEAAGRAVLVAAGAVTRLGARP
jgi:sugar/nucleoside kinase (ribokinase family)